MLDDCRAERLSHGDSAEDPRTRVLGVEQLLPVLEAKAEAAAEHARAPFGGADYEVCHTIFQGGEDTARPVKEHMCPNLGKSTGWVPEVEMPGKS